MDRPRRGSRLLSDRSHRRRLLLRAVLGDGRQHGQHDIWRSRSHRSSSRQPRSASGATCGSWSWHSPHTAFSMRSTARSCSIPVSRRGGLPSVGRTISRRRAFLRSFCVVRQHNRECAPGIGTIAVMSGWRLRATPLALTREAHGLAVEPWRAILSIESQLDLSLEESR